jgi:hypothetical protein
MGLIAARRTRPDLRKKEEGRRKKEEGRRKKEEGRRKKEKGKRKKESTILHFLAIIKSRHTPRRTPQCLSSCPQSPKNLCIYRL